MAPSRPCGAARTNSTAWRVVMCSSTTRSAGTASSSGASTSSRKRASRSKMSTSPPVTSPCTSSGSPAAAMASSAGRTCGGGGASERTHMHMRRRHAPCGRRSRRRRCWWWRPRGSTCTRPQSRWRRRRRCPLASCCLSVPKTQHSSGSAACACRANRGRDAPVRYSVISGSNAAPGGTAASTRWRYAAASASVRTGGFRLGITTARPNTRAVKGTTEVSEGPSRRCRCLRRAGRRRQRQAVPPRAARRRARASRRGA